jgi:hypothetical protein
MTLNKARASLSLLASINDKLAISGEQLDVKEHKSFNKKKLKAKYAHLVKVNNIRDI